MALFNPKDTAKPKYRFNHVRFIQPGDFSEEELPIAQLIQRRRLQLLIHSRLYYELNTNLITDHEFDRIGNELVELQNQYPEIAARVVFAKDFQDWDASTGAFLPLNDPWVEYKANQLLAHGGKNEHTKIQQSTRVQSSQKPKGKKASEQRRNSLF